MFEETTATAEAPVTVEGAMALPTHAPLHVTLPRDGFPNSTSKGNLLNTIENLAYLCKEYGIVVRYNEMSRRLEITIPGESYLVDNRANNALARVESICALNAMPRSNVGSFLLYLGAQNSYHPVREWVNSKPWDGVSRLREFYDTLPVADGYPADFRDALLRRWMLNAIASVYHDKHETHGVLVLQGAGGAGKTKWFKGLGPDGVESVMDGATLDPGNKDSVITAVGHWIVELGELDATFRKADIAKLKAFVTKYKDSIRLPYAKEDSELRRRTVFAGSVNPGRYLVDDTGTRRWWSIAITDINYRHGIDMQQLWAEVLVMLEAGEQTWLTKAEHDKLAELNGERFEAIDPLEELVREKFDFEAVQHNLPGFQRDPAQWLSATSVLLAIGYEKPAKLQSNAMSAVLRKLTGVESSKRGGQRVFPMPAKRPFLGAEK